MYHVFFEVGVCFVFEKLFTALFFFFFCIQYIICLLSARPIMHFHRQPRNTPNLQGITMEEPLQQQQQDAAAPQQQQDQNQMLLTPAALEPAAPPVTPTLCGRNAELEVAVRQALEGPTRDLGRLCKTLGEAFCLPSFRSAPRAAGYDSGSDTTAPADQEHSSSESNGSETWGDVGVGASGSSAGGSSGGKGHGKGLEDGNVQAVAAAAEVSVACGGLVADVSRCGIWCVVCRDAARKSHVFFSLAGVVCGWWVEKLRQRGQMCGSSSSF